MDRALHALGRTLDASREIESEARLLAGFRAPALPAPLPRRPRLTSVACLTDENLARSLATTGVELEDRVAAAGDLRGSYEAILDGMRQKSDVWAHIPSITPVEDAQLTSGFGARVDPFTGDPALHQGLDLQAAPGTPVRASAYGRVVLAGSERGYGQLVEIDHGNGIRTRYGHNAQLLVRVGERVRRGQIIARVGQTGRASAPHLHYEVLVDGHPVNPEPHVFPGATLAD